MFEMAEPMLYVDSRSTCEEIMTKHAYTVVIRTVKTKEKMKSQRETVRCYTESGLKAYLKVPSQGFFSEHAAGKEKT